MKLMRLINPNELELIHDDAEDYSESITIILRDNSVFRIYERRPGVLEFSADRVLHIEPRATNVIHARSARDAFEAGS